MAPLRAVGVEVRGRGFGFAILEGSERLIDWGGAKVPRRDVSVFLARLVGVMARYRVDVVVLEEPAGSARGPRVRTWLAWAEQTATERGVRVVMVDRESLGRAFSQSGSTRYQIALATTRRFPELAPLLPPPRRRWESEAVHMRTLIAAARACVGLAALERDASQ